MYGLKKVIVGSQKVGQILEEKKWGRFERKKKKWGSFEKKKKSGANLRRRALGSDQGMTCEPACGGWNVLDLPAITPNQWTRNLKTPITPNQAVDQKYLKPRNNWTPRNSS